MTFDMRGVYSNTACCTCFSHAWFDFVTNIAPKYKLRAKGAKKMQQFIDRHFDGNNRCS